MTFKRSITAASRTVGEDYERGRAEIDPAHGRIFCGSADRGLYALRALDGTTIWRFDTLAFVQSEPLYDRELDIVYFGSNDGALYAVRALDGSLVYRFMSGAEVARKPIVAGETLYFANAADHLFAIDRRSGALKWKMQRTPALGMEVAGYAGPARALGRIYMAYSDGHVMAYNEETGTEAWSVDLSAEAEHSAGGDAQRYLDVDTTPVIDTTAPTGPTVYVASYAGGVSALDAETGKRVWANDKATGVTELLLWEEQAHEPSALGPDQGGPRTPARKILIASSGTTGLWGMDPTSGKMLWQNPVPEGGITAPVPIQGALLVGTTRYGVFLISPRNGKSIDGLNLGSGFAQTPAAYGSRAFIVSNQGTLLGLHVEAPMSAAAREARAKASGGGFGDMFNHSNTGPFSTTSDQ